MVKLACRTPTGTVTVGGTLATVLLLLERVTVTAAEGGAYLKVTVPVAGFGPTMLVGSSDNALTACAVPAGQTLSCAVGPKSSPLNDVRIVALA